MTGQNSAFILLATYNGEQFVRDQIASIQKQTHADWRLLIADDGSTDSTVNILEALQREDDRIELLPASVAPAAGPCETFNRLLLVARERDARLCVIADQDDIWFPWKLARLLQAFPQNGMEPSPLLLHSDLQLIDSAGGVISASFIDRRGFQAAPAKPLNQLLTLNFVTGCSACINRRLLHLSTPIPPPAMMHDWWLALVAAATGEIRYIPEALMAYRQHGQNAIGASGELTALKNVAGWKVSWEVGQKELMYTFVQAEALRERLTERQCLSKDAGELLDQYLQISHCPAVRRLQRVGQLNLREGKWLLKLVLYLRLMFVSAS